MAVMHEFAHNSRSDAFVRALMLLPIGSRCSRGRLPDGICTACSGTVTAYGSFTARLPATAAKSLGTTGSKRPLSQSRQSRTRRRVDCHSLYFDHHMVASWVQLGTSPALIIRSNDPILACALL